MYLSTSSAYDYNMTLITIAVMSRDRNHIWNGSQECWTTAVAVGNPRPHDERCSTVEARLAPARAVAAGTEHVKFGELPPRRRVDRIVTHHRVQSAPQRQNSAINSRINRAAQA